MKKLFFAIAAVAMLASCTGNKEGEKSGSAAPSGKAGFEFKVENGISGTTGSKNCFLADLGAPIEFKVEGEGAELDVTATVEVSHTDKTEVDESSKSAELWVSGRDDDNKDVKVKLFADEENLKKLQEWFPKAKGEKVKVEFKGKAPKADLEKLNGKKTTNTLVI